TLPLSNVLITPAIQKNILSVSKLVDDTHSSVEFTPSSVCLKDLHTKRTLARGERRGNMYVFEEAPVPLKASSTVTSSFPAYLSQSSVMKCNKPDSWHRRLGHCSQGFLDKLSSQGFISKVVLDHKCPSCNVCKSHVLPFHSINKRASKPFEIIHSYVWGPAPVSSLSGSRYYVLFLDSFYPLHLDLFHEV
ncbi:GAG-pre-integrase domain-containing protein, partial [Klebsiella pneumoniae]|uniref:GAG-pre-integrase domain-containing protein n=1 Tax=Klebsiella pneumoniae TaxID=573 RepID=UPI003A80CA9D